MLIRFLLSLLLFVVSAFASKQMESSSYALESEAQEVLYLPSGRGLEAISFGYKNFFSDILWFNTISYFGEHFANDRNYQWLGHMCNLVTDLNPNALHVYRFCSNMLSWESQKPKEAVALLGKAIEAHPKDWEWYYHRGINSLLFLNDSEAAARDFQRASKLPDVPVIVKRLAAKKVLSSDPETAIELLQSMIQEAEDESERKALEERLKEAVFELVAGRIEQAAKIFYEKNARSAESVQELEQAGILKVDSLKDPFGGEYRFNPETQKVESSSGRKRINLYQKKNLREQWESFEHE